MKLRHILLCSLVPFLASCQLLRSSDDAPAQRPDGLERRWQGELRLEHDQPVFISCQSSRRFALRETTGLDEAARALRAGSSAPLFLDLSGTGSGGELLVARVHRLQAGADGCADPDFRRLILQAVGSSPDWRLSITAQGLLLQRPGEAPQALPYLEEQLPGGQTSFSSEADGRRLELWVAPQRCENLENAVISHLNAQLRVDGEVFRGCAWYGGARGE